MYFYFDSVALFLGDKDKSFWWLFYVSSVQPIKGFFSFLYDRSDFFSPRNFYFFKFFFNFSLSIFRFFFQLVCLFVCRLWQQIVLTIQTVDLFSFVAHSVTTKWTLLFYSMFKRENVKVSISTLRKTMQEYMAVAFQRGIKCTLSVLVIIRILWCYFFPSPVHSGCYCWEQSDNKSRQYSQYSR